MATTTTTHHHRTIAMVAIAICAGLLIGATPASTPTLPACATEDSDNCVWDAAQHGNGHGLSFITVNGVTYLSR